MGHTRKVYTKDSKLVNLELGKAAEGKLARIVWEPGTHEALSKFPEGPRRHLGYYLYLVQRGETPPDSSPVAGLANVFELRDQDERAWYRVIHLKKMENRIHVLHCFEKRSNQIEKRDIRSIQERLGRLKEWLAEEKRNAKREKAGTARDHGKRSG